MTDTATDTTPQQTQETPPPAPEPQAQPQGDGDPAALDITNDAAVDAHLDQAAIEVPGDDKLVPLSEVGKVGQGYRAQIKTLRTELDTAKQGSAKAAQLEQQIASLTQQVQQLSPYVQAYQAMQQAAQQAASPDDDADAIEFAKELDLYTSDGKPDVARARKSLARLQSLADKAAQQHVAPLQHQTVTQQSSYNLARAKNTTLPNGAKADPAMLDLVWKQLDPSLTATREGALQALIAAVGYTQVAGQPAAQQTAQRAPNGQFTAQPLPAPLVTEKAGGRTDPGNLPLSKHEQDYIKASGMTEKEYLAATPPWMRK